MPAFRSISEVGSLGQLAQQPPAGGWGTTAAGLFQTGVNLLNMEQQAKIAKEQRKAAEAQARAAIAAAQAQAQAQAQAAGRPAQASLLPFDLSPVTLILGVLAIGGVAWAVSRASK